MEVIWVSEDLGGPKGEGADGELEKLKALGSALGLVVSGMERVEGEGAVPRRGHGAGPLQRHGDKVRLRDVGPDIRQRVVEVRLRHLLHTPFLVGFCAEAAFMHQQ